MKQQANSVKNLEEKEVSRRVRNEIIEFFESTIFVVPNGVSAVQISAVGACGGSGNGFGVLLNNGGEGARAVSNVKVTPGESLEIFVGVRGQDGGLPKGGLGGCSAAGHAGGAAASGRAGGGGGGGGASGVIRILGEEILVLASGGGGGSGAGAGGRINCGDSASAHQDSVAPRTELRSGEGGHGGSTHATSASLTAFGGGRADGSVVFKFALSVN